MGGFPPPYPPLTDRSSPVAGDFRPDKTGHRLSPAVNQIYASLAIGDARRFCTFGNGGRRGGCPR
jgi:hypothetical protein